MALLLASPVGAADRQLKEAELAKLRTAIESLREDLDQVRQRHGRLSDELRETESRIGRLGKSLRRFDREVEERRQHLGALQEQKTALMRTVARQRSGLAGQIRAAYLMGGQGYTKLLLNQKEPATLGRVLVYYDYFNRARAQRISTLEETRRRVEALEAEIGAEMARLEDLRAGRLAEKRSLEESRRERRALLVRLKGELNTKDQRLEGLLGDERELKALLDTLKEVLDDLPAGDDRQPFARLRGRLRWPAPGPLQAAFGAPRGQGKLRWEGVLIRAPEGQEVRAVSRGRVAFADWLRGYGLLIIVDHGDGYMSLYGHNQSLFKETGDWVETEEVIATVGASGGQEREALYFEIRHNGAPQDPARWCRRQG